MVGIVRAAHGLDGELKIESLSGEYDHFMRMSRVTLRLPQKSAVFAVTHVKSTGKSLLMCLESIDHVDSAAGWVGAEVVVSRSLGAPVHDGEYYYADLVGCRVLCSGATVGEVRAVVELPHCDVLEVETDAGRSVFVPFQEVFVGAVDVDRRTIELLAGWLVE